MAPPGRPPTTSRAFQTDAAHDRASAGALAVFSGGPRKCERLQLRLPLACLPPPSTQPCSRPHPAPASSYIWGRLQVLLCKQPGFRGGGGWVLSRRAGVDVSRLRAAPTNSLTGQHLRRLVLANALAWQKVESASPRRASMQIRAHRNSPIHFRRELRCVSRAKASTRKRTKPRRILLAAPVSRRTSRTCCSDSSRNQLPSPGALFR